MYHLREVASPSHWIVAAEADPPQLLGRPHGFTEQVTGFLVARKLFQEVEVRQDGAWANPAQDLYLAYFDLLHFTEILFWTPNCIQHECGTLEEVL